MFKFESAYALRVRGNHVKGYTYCLMVSSMQTIIRSGF